MPLSLQEKFEKAYTYIQGLPKGEGPFQPTQDRQLQYYRYFKQGTIGDVNIPRPGLFDFAGKAKWDAWNDVKGSSKEAAQEEYVKLLIEDLEKISNRSEDAEKLLAELKA
ncbi:Acbp from Moniliophthora Perniciosa [Phlebopus sp. FC_14]|nr:Acbp from Moniliophthora Perniciosa [Phlebopus sp. FC_14]